MPKPTPKWAHSPKPGRVPPLPVATLAAIRALFDIPRDDADALITTATLAAARYRLARTQHTGPDRAPTPAELREAAAELSKRTQALAELLDTPELGGLLEFMPDIADADPRGFVLGLRADLQTLNNATADVTYMLPAMRPATDPRRDFARDVARAVLTYTGKRPTAYFSVEYGKRGPYAALLGLLFEAVDGAEPGDLRKLVQAGVRATR